MNPEVESLIEKYKKRKASQPPAVVLRIARMLRKNGHSSTVAQATAWSLWAKYDSPSRTASELMPRIASALEQQSLPLCRFIEANWSSRSVVGGLPSATNPGGGGGGGSSAPAAPSGGGGGGGGGSSTPTYYSGCFAKGTSILMSDGSSKPIEDVKVGDTVVSYNPDEGSIVSEGTVTHLPKQHWREDWRSISFGSFSNTNTECHPYWTKEKGWASLNPDKTMDYHKVDVAQLEVGDHCLKIEGRETSWLPILAVEDAKHQYTYNLDRVTPQHAYFANGVLVHNKMGHDLEEGEDDLNSSIDECYETIREASGRAANLTAHIARHLGESEQVAIAGGMFASQVVTKLGHKLLHEV